MHVTVSRKARGPHDRPHSNLHVTYSCFNSLCEETDRGAIAIAQYIFKLIIL